MGFRFEHTALDGVEIKFSVPNDFITWPEIYEQFYKFLLGCGYIIPELEITEKNEKCDCSECHTKHINDLE